MGIMGACRSNELHLMKVKDVQDLGTTILVTIPKTKTKIIRRFTITGDYYGICKKYINLRPTNIEDTAFFLNYQNGKCTSQRIGINKFGSTGKVIATFLKLPNPNIYTGHSLRRTSATLLIDAGGDITALKRHGGWKSTSVAEGYIDDSMNNKIKTASTIFQSVNPNQPSTSISTNENINVNPITSLNITDMTTTNKELNSAQPINFTNCSNFTINFITNPQQ